MEDFVALYAWYRRSHRPLPWRRTRDPYRIWVSEVMLQQTRVETAIGRYRRFLRRFPSLRALAAAQLDDVLAEWEGLGYYARARNLHAAARRIDAGHRGRLPSDVAGLAALPGIGRSTAGAIASIAHGVPAPVLDGNVRRVLVRLEAIRRDPASPAVTRRLWTLAERLALAAPDPAMHTQAMMELGATVCTPRAPRCDACPLRRRCRARRSGLAERLPVRIRRRRIPLRRMAAGVLVRAGRVLVRRRPERGLLGGLWELPGCEPGKGEPPEDAVRAEFRTAAGFRVRVAPAFVVVKHAFSHFRITLSGHACRIVGGRSGPRMKEGWAWIDPTPGRGPALPRAHRRVLEAFSESKGGVVRRPSRR